MIDAVILLYILYVIGGLAAVFFAIVFFVKLISIGVRWAIRDAHDELKIIVQEAILSANKIHAEYQKKKEERVLLFVDDKDIDYDNGNKEDK